MPTAAPEQYPSQPQGSLPNSRFPLLIHRGGVAGGGEAALLERFRGHGWSNNWRYPGIYTYRHFHSTTHECLGVATGWMDIEFFGDGGPELRVGAGDVIVLPAGVSHSMVAHSDDVMVVGGYPDGRDWDNMRQDQLSPERHYHALKRIMMLPIPARDPVTGEPIAEWLAAPSSVDAGFNEQRDAMDAGEGSSES